MRHICSDRVPTVGGSPRRWGHRRYNDDGPRTRGTHYALARARHEEPICPNDEEKLNRSADEQIDWSR
jgi:hypothetical protein